MGVDPYADVEPISVRDFLRRSREVLNGAQHLGRRYVITRLGRPSVLVSPAPRELRLTAAARRNLPPSEPVELTPLQRDVLQAVEDRELHPFMNRLGPGGQEARAALGGMDIEGLIDRSPSGSYAITEAGRAALAAAREGREGEGSPEA